MIKKSPRHLSRSIAVQGIYHYKLNNSEIFDIEQFLKSNPDCLYNKAESSLLTYLLEQGINQFEQMLKLYEPYLQREMSEINLLEQIILVIAAIELTYTINVPAAVVINEAIELCKLYGAEESHKFINGLVDKLAHETRKEEIKHYRIKHYSHKNKHKNS